jgi:hypothetical protein
VQGGGAAVHGHGVLGADEFGKIFFELHDIGSEAERAIVERAGNGGVKFGPDGTHLGFEIEIRDGFH